MIEINNTFQLSLIMPVFNAEKYLKDSIESILNQTFKDFELIVIDDGSNDGTDKLIQQFSSKDKRIRQVINRFQLKIIRNHNKICVEGRDIASKILTKNPKYDLAFYFKCNVKVASYRRWLDVKKKVPLKDVRSSLKKRTQMDKKRKNSPLIKVKDAILIRTDILNKKQVLSKMSKSIDRLT